MTNKLGWTRSLRSLRALGLGPFLASKSLTVGRKLRPEWCDDWLVMVDNPHDLWILSLTEVKALVAYRGPEIVPDADDLAFLLLDIGR